MNPFSAKLKSFRINRGLRQSELAEKIGYEQSYISSLEIGLKGPPTSEFVSGLVRVLNLSADERNEVDNAIAASQRKIFIPSQASEEVYWLCHNLQQQLEHLHPLQISLIKTALSLPQEMNISEFTESARLRKRSSKIISKEALM